jgi:hypothetical protein
MGFFLGAIDNDIFCLIGLFFGDMGIPILLISFLGEGGASHFDFLVEVSALMMAR